MAPFILVYLPLNVFYLMTFFTTFLCFYSYFNRKILIHTEEGGGKCFTFF